MAMVRVDLGHKRRDSGLQPPWTPARVARATGWKSAQTLPVVHPRADTSQPCMAWSPTGIISMGRTTREAMLPTTPRTDQTRLADCLVICIQVPTSTSETTCPQWVTANPPLQGGLTILWTCWTWAICHEVTLVLCLWAALVRGRRVRREIWMTTAPPPHLAVTQWIQMIWTRAYLFNQLMYDSVRCNVSRCALPKTEWLH